MGTFGDSRRRLPVLVAAIALMGVVPGAAGADGDASGEKSGDSLAALAAGFRDPPASARPAAYWAWLNGNFDRKQMTWEMEQFKDQGVSALQIFDVGARGRKEIVPAGPAFMGPESLGAIGHAVREAKRLGLSIGLTTSSSWNAGGTWVKPEDASMGLYRSQLALQGPREFNGVLPFPEVPAACPKRDDGLPVYYKDVAVLAVPELERAGVAKAQAGPPPVVKNPKAIVDLTGQVDSEGRLRWQVPEGKWLVMRFVCTNTGQGLFVPSPNSEGLAIDHFRREATAKHFQFFVDKLRGELGSLDDSALKFLYLCSYELRGRIWTPDLLDEFRRRRGYDMTRYLPALFGAKIENEEITRRFKYDFDKTVGDLLADEFYQQAREVCHRNGLLLCAEAGGPGPPVHNVPVNALKALGSVDIMRGEFWNQHDIWVVKETACAAHVYGHKVVDMESFTSWRHWLDGPFELKPVADRALCEGTNHFTFHTAAHNPPEAGKPGWVYHAGTHMGPNRAWWPMARAFVDYLARCSYLLQQGHFVADVCYYYGDQAYNFVPPKHVPPGLGPGYDYDVVNAEVLLERMAVKDGRLTLPDGMSYAVLVLPDREDMDLDVLVKLEKLVAAGATVIGPKPTRTNGLAGYPDRDRQVRELADKLWGGCDGRSVTENVHGKGRIIWGRTPREILEGRGIGPDFRYEGRDAETRLDYLHRRTADADIYFVRNCGDRWERVECTFRVAGRAPQLWLPDRGERHPQAVYDRIDGGTRVPLELPPCGSVFVVFVEGEEGEHVRSVLSDRGRLFPFPRTTSDAPNPPDSVALAGGGVTAVVLEDGVYGFETNRGRRFEVTVDGVPDPRPIEGPWEVRFTEGWGAPPSVVFPELKSWTAADNEGVRYYSGVAVYHKEFEMPAEAVAANRRWFLDLGRVAVVGEVALNGRPLGIVWKPPYRVEVTEALRAGTNRLAVKVANTWCNRLIGDAQLPAGKRYTNTNMTNALTWESPWKETPLRESGLLGPMRLVAAQVIAGKAAADSSGEGSGESPSPPQR